MTTNCLILPGFETTVFPNFPIFCSAVILYVWTPSYTFQYQHVSIRQHLLDITNWICFAFIGTPVQMHEGNMYDELCFFAHHAKICDICSQSIVGSNVRFLTSGEKYFHPACYVCYKCRKSLSGLQYYVVARRRLCVACVSTVSGKQVRQDSF